MLKLILINKRQQRLKKVKMNRQAALDMQTQPHKTNINKLL